MDLPQMLPDIEPEKFFTEFAPAQFEKNKAALPDETLATNIAITFELTGQGGGTWSLLLDSGKLAGKAGEVSYRTVKIVQAIEDWQSAVRGEKGFRIELPGKGDKSNMRAVPALNQEKVNRLQKINGAVKFKLIDLDRGDWEITAVFGAETAPEPNCTVTMSAEDAALIRKGELNPQTAFMAGKINIQGDLGFAMQIGTALMF